MTNSDKKHPAAVGDETHHHLEPKHRAHSHKKVSAPAASSPTVAPVTLEHHHYDGMGDAEFVGEDHPAMEGYRRQLEERQAQRPSAAGSHVNLAPQPDHLKDLHANSDEPVVSKPLHR